MNEFEQLLRESLIPLRRYISFKISSPHDAEDVLQDVCLTATEKFHTLRNTSAFKAWIIGIASNKCKNYYRAKAKELNISLDDLSESVLTVSCMGIVEDDIVSDTLDLLGDKDKQILYLYYIKNLSQKEISVKLSLPVGTVKSRLHYAKENFKKLYPYPPKPKGEDIVTKLPEYLPEYKIRISPEAPFSVKFEELLGFCVIPRVGEKITWGSYFTTDRKRADYTEVEVTGKVEIHGIEGVDIIAKEHLPNDENITVRNFAAQLTDTHCRYLAESHVENGVRKCFTFLDSDVFADNWGFGEGNCGYETTITPKGTIRREGNTVETSNDTEELDIVGRYTVTIGTRSYDTVCVMNIGHFKGKIAIEQYLDRHGRTVLWRRFNRNDWAIKRYGKPWCELLPENDKLEINGETFVHWYDCVTDYIF